MHSPSCRNQNSAIGIFLCQLVSAFPGPGRHPSIFRPIGSWRAPSLRQMRLLRQTYFAFLRKLLRLGPEAHVSNQTALVKTNTADVRIFLALGRLRYARKVFQISSEITQNRVHLEFAKCQDSWLHGLFADLVRLGQVLPNAIPNIKELQKEDLTSMIEAWQRCNHYRLALRNL